MWILISAVVSASLLGSLHCVGMCGPLAIWASGAGEGQRATQLAVASGLYHFGRLLTYALAGFIAGAVGQILDQGGQSLGIQLVAARVVGTLMILIGLVKLWQLLSPHWLRHGAANPGTAASGPTLRPSRISAWLVRLRPWVFSLPVPLRALITGLLTTLLPCGWLYLFALLAAGTGSMVTGPVVMAAFWLGSVPALVALVSGTQLLAVRFRQGIPLATAVVLIMAGGYTAAGRGFANLHALSDIRPSGLPTPAAAGSTAAADLATHVSQLVETPLPCCVEVPLGGEGAAETNASRLDAPADGTHSPAAGMLAPAEESSMQPALETGERAAEGSTP